ncbi:hypothetical protein N431DRAFT_463224 [Stipitochalara longipes BDJ]|nr:hypothetical protein N431DRAFT_463224 [Stipitochalara longipes BDJ]
MKTHTTAFTVLVALAASVANGWTVSPYQCDGCTGCPADTISGTGTAYCTYFNQPVSSVSSEAQVEGCQVYLYFGLDSCQAGTGAQEPNDGQCAPEGGGNDYYFSVICS